MRWCLQDYVVTLSVLCRGTVDEKLRWIFRLYDINSDGQVTREVSRMRTGVRVDRAMIGF